ncbi:MAG: hypothetical protein LBV69_12145 [Bacteroidales bacterium]|nr:hypothetical protein [Bacteroidales bacterium]
MANRRDLKKEINLLHYEVITDCIAYLDVNQKQDDSKVETIINKMMDARERIFAEINKPTSKMSKKDVRTRYYQIINEVKESTDGLYEILSTLPRD